ncbi:bifunctional (p)ppGpp synthetase/guanosine-3',5'-bis(diphosphate) 3'-pyrophosphohydrolase, partial [Xylella fastidiosa subsp. multiplex]|nr:bifunctional (p)ppGpp synthetase/guanosine-3',5'-bis(diphosphate) 3'-pyrophosphohydrolase [Xylella fastidiosa subsp. multiplex]
GFLASRRSRDKVRALFNKIERARNVQVGKESLDRELKRGGQQHVDLSPIARRFHADSVDDLYVPIALGNLGPNQVSRALLETARVVASA